MKTYSIPVVVPFFRPDPALVAAIQAQIDRIKLNNLAKAVRVARSVA